MEPLNSSKAISLQDSLAPALDLSMNYKKSHIASRSTEAVVKKSTWRDRGTVDQSPMGFSGVKAEHCSSQPCPGNATKDDSDLALREPFDVDLRSGSRSRFNGHQSASHFPSDVYNCKADLPKKGKVRNTGQEVQHPLRRTTRVDHQNGFGSHFPVSKAFGEYALDTRGNSNHTNSSTPCVSKSISLSKGCKTVIESSVGNPNPSHVSYRGFTTQGHSVNPVSKKVITEVKHSSSPICIESDDSDIVEVPVSNVSHNIQSSQISTSPSPSACAQTLNSHTNTNSTGSSGKCESDGMYGWASEYSTSGTFAAQPPKPTSCTTPSEESVGDPIGVTEADAQSPLKQQKTGSHPGQAKASPGKAKRKKKKQQRQGQPSSSSMFSPQEPEIRLKYANQKEEKRDSRTDSSFCPYVRVELREFPACSVVNCQDEEETLQKKGRHRSTAPLKPTAQASGAVPSTSCLRLGRLNADSRGKPTQTCCLCGWPANSMGLGDLHGPYYPSECKQSSKQPLSSLLGQSDPREVENSQGYSENSPWNPSKRPRRDWTTDDCSHASAALVAEQNSGERWIHEDCSIWAAGVFLIKGRLYGLEEAIRLASETVCSCCHKVGATLGCFFKGCYNKYHYICALKSDCLLNEDNFSMRCLKHKNKSSRPVTR